MSVVGQVRARTHSRASIFHQSSAFELRTAGRTRHWAGTVDLVICDGGALRANRFVAGSLSVKVELWPQCHRRR
jgi:hypothetical protein